MGPPRPAADDPTADVEDDPLTRHPLYGGALAAALPARFCDVSAARPVPDHAEAWGDPESDQSIVFEVVEHDPALPDADAAAFFFADQAAQNEARASSLTATAAPDLATAIPSLAATPPSPGAAGAALLTAAGTQAVSKGRTPADAAAADAAANTVDIGLAVLRLPAVGADLLIVVNSGLRLAGGSGAGGGAGVAAPGGRSAALLGRVLASLAIADWGLFG